MELHTEFFKESIDAEIQYLTYDETLEIEGGIIPLVVAAALFKGICYGVALGTALYGTYRLAQS
jgi:hypothetical protein